MIIKPANIYDQYSLNNIFISYQQSGSNFYYTRKPFKEYHLKNQEFNFVRKINSIGIPEIEIENIEPKNNIRILCLGDSFTEGDGTDQDSTYVRYLDRSLRKKSPNIEVINAGRCGSDPFFDFKLYHDLLIKYQPDIIIQSFTTNDLFFDMVMRGGNERFQKDKTIKYYNNYWWTPIYAVSFTSRILIQAFGGYDKYLIRQKDYPQLVDKMKEESAQLFKEYYEFTKENHADLIVFTLPFKEHFKIKENKEFNKEMGNNFSKFGLQFYDLQPCYEEEIKANQTTFKDYYWKIDGHHNAKGYEMMAKCLEKIVTPIIEKRIK
ncbi:MAG TPA: SGNH/GDSL hydrolase family protein [Chitinophagales bacterium]|nr:SGNH/GDSL hydrolase family protein [Chitinophagales bacterium]